MSSDQSSGASFSHIAQAMRDEGEHQLVEGVRPLRVTGFISLLFGLLSGLCFLSSALIFLPLISLVTGFFAIRKYDGEVPVGLRAGRVGMLLAVALGATAFGTNRFQTNTLCSQAEKFTADYLGTIAAGQIEVALELARPVGSRSKAPLLDLYRTNEGMMKARDEFVNNGLTEPLGNLGEDVQWRVSRPTTRDRLYGGGEQFEVVMVDEGGRLDIECQVFLKYVRDREGNFQWHIFHAQPYRELIVAKGLY